MKIVTYNIHKGMDSNNKLTLCEIGKYLKNLNCSIICLQEVLYHQYLELKKILKIEGVFAANVKNPTMLYGICIFSKNNIVSYEHVLLTSKKEQRGFIHLTIFNKEKINIINTHLGLDKEERVVQIDEILNFKNKFEGKNIICGDFNEKNISINTFEDSASVGDGYEIGTFPKSNSRIDYIYIENGIKIKNYFVDEINLSDHYPVIVEIEK
ncbi:MAG: endonuclease/exonuclease/phosphatase family protein [Peptostreptococcaceae bacterium]